MSHLSKRAPSISPLRPTPTITTLGLFVAVVVVVVIDAIAECAELNVSSKGDPISNKVVVLQRGWKR